MNLGQIRTAIQQRGYGTDTATAQNELINSVYRRMIGMRRWPFLEVANNTSISTVADTNSYDLTTITDLLHVDAVRIESTASEFLHLRHKPYQEFRNFQHEFRNNAAPAYWTRIGDDLHLWPDPDKVYTLNIDYIKDPPDLTTDSDSPIFPVAWHDILVWGSIVELSYRERDGEGFGMAKNEWQLRLYDMMNQYGLRQRQTADQVRYSGTYDHLSPPGILDAEDILWQIW